MCSQLMRLNFDPALMYIKFSVLDDCHNTLRFCTALKIACL